MRRNRLFLMVITLIALAFPMAASAGGADGDPDGLVAAVPAATGWLDSLVRVFVAWLGI